MNKVRRSSFVEGTLIATLSIVFSKFLGILYVIPFYNMIGDEGSHLYAYAYSIYVIFLDISTCGLPIAISKLVNEYDSLNMNEEKIRTYYISRRIIFIISIIIFLLMFFLSYGISKFLVGDLVNGSNVSDVSLVIKAISFSILVVPLLSVGKGYLQGHNVINISSMSQVIEQVIKICFILVSTYLSIYVFNFSIGIVISISLLGIFISGLIAYRFLYSKLVNMIPKYNYKYNKEDVVIIKKLFSYAIPYIIINVISSLYNFVDMSLMLKGLNYLNYDTNLIEYATSSITTWAPKINMIVSSIAMGMSMSLIPIMVGANTLHKYKEVESNINQSLSIIMYVSVPLCVFIFLFSDHIWNVFYGYNVVGSLILKYSIVYAFLINVYMTISSILQGLNKFKIVYILTIVGFLVNMLLDIPFIMLFNKGYIGAIVATIVGYSVSIVIGIFYLCKELNISYKVLKCNMVKIILCSLVMVMLLIISKVLWNVSLVNRINSVIYVIIEGALGVSLYLYITYKFKIIDKVFKKTYLDR